MTYVPDPEAETAATIRAFFDALAQAFTDESDLADRLAARHGQLVAEQGHRVVDEPSRHNLSLTLAVLAADLELRQGRYDAQLLPALRDAFVHPMQHFVHQATRAALDGAADPFAAMVAISKSREQQAFGAGFEFAHPEDDSRRYTAEVRRCYYHDVLAANDAAHLTPIFCAFDFNWIDAIDPARDGLRVERPTTIGTGGSTCPFQFSRSERTPG